MRNPDGTFVRTMKPWSLENFNDGYVDSKGRFRVYYPDHPRSYKGGYILRSIVAYEAYHPNDKITRYENIHHKDKNRSNDSRENLEKVSTGVHAIIHFSKQNGETYTCVICEKQFYVSRWRINQRKKRGYPTGKYCSLECFYKREVSTETRNKMSLSRIRRCKCT